MAGLLSDQNTAAVCGHAHCDHAAGQNRLDRVEKRPIPVVVQNAPATFDGIVLAVRGRVRG